MPQQAFNAAETPCRFIVNVAQDPVNPDSGTSIVMSILSNGHKVLGSGAVNLIGIECDFAETFIEAGFAVFMYGTPRMLAPNMRTLHSRAKAHRMAHTS